MKIVWPRAKAPTANFKGMLLLGMNEQARKPRADLIESYHWWRYRVDLSWTFWILFMRVYPHDQRWLQDQAHWAWWHNQLWKVMVKRWSFMVSNDEKIFIINVCNWEFLLTLSKSLKYAHKVLDFIFCPLKPINLIRFFCYIIAINMNVSSIRMARHAGSWYPAQSNLSFMPRKHSRKRSWGVFRQRQKVTQYPAQPNQGHHWSSRWLSIQWSRSCMGISVLPQTSFTKPQNILIGTFSSQVFQWMLTFQIRWARDAIWKLVCW